MVSSTTPRFGPRWPPVTARLLISRSRISSASWGSSEIERSFTSSGELIVSRIVPITATSGPHRSKTAPTQVSRSGGAIRQTKELTKYSGEIQHPSLRLDARNRKRFLAKKFFTANKMRIELHSSQNLVVSG